MKPPNTLFSIQALLPTFRGYLWNFRDAATVNPLMRPGYIFRTSSLTRYQNKSFFIPLIAHLRLTGIIDLRTDEEKSENPYLPDILLKCHYEHVPIDPRIQSEAFKSRYEYGSNVEIAYRYFVYESKAAVKTVVEMILSHPVSEAVAIHCFAGKDRTGFIIALFHMLLETDWSVIEKDYLASGMDTNPAYLNIIREGVSIWGGIEAYFQSCGLSEDQISQFKKMISYA